MNSKKGCKCAVYGCNNYYKRKKDTKSFFRMTRDADRLVGETYKLVKF